jgi:hypothetical protein
MSRPGKQHDVKAIGGSLHGECLSPCESERDFFSQWLILPRLDGALAQFT